MFGENYSIVDGDNYDAVMVRSAVMHDMAFPESLKAIARAGAGVNNIPIDECTKKGIVVFNTPGANANAVKEMVICGLILASRKIVPAIMWASTLSGDDVAKQVEAGKSQFVGPEIEGKKLGVIGLGAVGVMVCNAAHHMGMDVYGYDPYISVQSAWGLSRYTHKSDDLKSLLSSCDYITIHIPMNNDTRGFINAEAISMMKKGVRILNFARGELVDTQAMLDGLKSGKVARYVTDFPDPSIIGVENVVAIPHLAASTPESEDNCARMAGTQLKQFLEYGIIRNSVNFPTIDMPKESKFRIFAIHTNTPGMLSQITDVLGVLDVNIDHLLNKSKGDYACTAIDVNTEVTPDIINKLSSIDGMLAVRII